jgi:putative lipoprotein
MPLNIAVGAGPASARRASARSHRSALREGGPLTRLALLVLPRLIAEQAMAQTIQGTATYRERMALPPGAVFEATIEDVSRADAPASVIASARVPTPGNPPIAFTIAYDPAKVLADHRYVVRARILLDNKLLFTTDTATGVITRGSPTSVSLMLRRVGAGQTAPSNPAGSRPLEGTHWKAIELAEKPTPTDAKHEAHLLFQSGGRVSGSDGCNRITGSYELKRDVVAFGQMAGTQMACIDTAEI